PSAAPTATGGTAPSAAGHAAEGTEVRFGTPACSVFAASTTLTSTGAVNCFHDSLTPFGGGIALFDITLGEIAPGGIGAGMYGILVLAIVTVFVAGLMVGRTPEYIGKKIRPTEMKYAALYFLAIPVVTLTAAALSIATHTGQAAIFNPGPHGLTEVMYAFASETNNNGSAFAGLGTAATWYQTLGGIAMLLGRFVPEIFALGLAGSLARQSPVPARAGTLDTRTPLFVGMAVGVSLILAGLAYSPALALGPFAEGLHGEGSDTDPAGRRHPPARRGPGPSRRRPARPEDPVEGASRRRQEAGPPGPVPQPGHVRRRSRCGDHDLHRDLQRQAAGLQLDDRRLLVAHGGVRQPGRGRGRGPRQGPGRDAAPDQAGDRGPPARRLAPGPGGHPRGGGARHPAHPRRLRGGRGRGDYPRRRRRGRGRGLGGRVRDHRRVGPGHPGVRRRPVRGHRRYQGAVRPDRSEDHLEAGR